MRISMTPIGWPLAAILVAATPGLAQTRAVSARTTRADADRMPTAPVPTMLVQVNTGRGRLVTLARPMSDLFIADDSIADVQVRSPTQLYVFGKKTGETTISATSKSGAVVYAATVRIGNNFDSIGQMLGLAMPEAHVVATPMNGLVLLTGTVAAPEDAAEAERLVQAFVGDQTKVLSRLKTATPLQVNLQVRIAEVSRSFVKNIGVNLRSQDKSTSGVGVASVSGTPGTITYDPITGAKTTTFAQGTQRSTLALAGRLLGTDFLSTIDLGETIGQISTLANPNLTALSGETATFLAGGEIPIPISQGLGAVSVEYKQYGVSLSFTPTVLSDGRISMRVRPEVSQLSSSGAVQLNGTTIPALTTRRIETTAELGSGESMVLGGLLSNSHDNSVEQTPGLGNLPVLGALFRSNGWKRNETELVVIITPYLVRPVANAADIKLPTDGYKAPTDLGRVFLGKLDGGQTGDPRPVPTMALAPRSMPSVGVVSPAPVLPVPDTTPGKADDRRDDTRRTRADARSNKTAAPGFSN